MSTDPGGDRQVLLNTHDKTGTYIKRLMDEPTGRLGAGFALRWFTPVDEVDLCVHATLASAHILLERLGHALGVPEDPVTGSAHSELAPYWAGRLGKKRLSARQVSKRGGNLHCEVRGNRAILSGGAVTFMEAEIIF
jgi:predicted PhzF superfamily epimerase YddE/YHI9